MNDHAQEKERNAERAAFADDTHGDVVSLKPVIRFLAMYRRVIALAVAAAVGLCILVLLILMLVLPVERTASLQVRLLFDGAAESRYPNGTPFSPAEIVSTPVLSEVYRINDLQRFGKYDDFKESMTVLQASLEHELLSAAYTARLADTKLTATDRARLEDEFRKRRAAIKDPHYTITMRRSSRLKVMPADLAEKVLNDTLAVWSEQAKALKGAVRFNVPVVSRNLLNAKSLDRDFLIAADDLRLQARRAVNITEGLMLIPGAASMRSQKEGVSLSDVSFTLADTLRTEVEPLVYWIQQNGMANDPAAMQRYVRGRVSELRLERDATRARIQSLQSALEGYMSAKGSRTREASAGTGNSGRQGSESQTLIPQLSDTFLDRIVEMSTQTQAADVAYRQDLAERLIREGVALSELDRDTAYYEQLEQAGRSGGSAVSATQAAAVKERLKAAAESVQQSIGRLVSFYDELSEQRLNPTGTLYATSTPFSTKTRYALTWSTVALSLALAVLLALVLAPIGCLYHRSSIARSSKPPITV